MPSRWPKYRKVVDRTSSAGGQLPQGSEHRRARFGKQAADTALQSPPPAMERPFRMGRAGAGRQGGDREHDTLRAQHEPPRSGGAATSPNRDRDLPAVVEPGSYLQPGPPPRPSRRAHRPAGPSAGRMRSPSGRDGLGLGGLPCGSLILPSPRNWKSDLAMSPLHVTRVPPRPPPPGHGDHYRTKRRRSVHQTGDPPLAKRLMARGIERLNHRRTPGAVASEDDADRDGARDGERASGAFPAVIRPVE
jgi:hypothetical protein